MFEMFIRNIEEVCNDLKLWVINKQTNKSKFKYHCILIYLNLYHLNSTADCSIRVFDSKCSFY